MAGAAAAACLHAGAFWRTRYLGLGVQAAAAAAAALAVACQMLNQASAAGQPAHEQQYCIDGKNEAFDKPGISYLSEFMSMTLSSPQQLFSTNYLSVLWLMLLALKTV